LRAAAKRYSAGDVLLVEWINGKFYRLAKTTVGPKSAWEEVDLEDIFR
jgi:hypothetical protein